MNTIECYQCEVCKKYLQVADSEYLIVSALTLERAKREKSWDATTFRIRTEIQQNSGDKKVFCSSACFHGYIRGILKEKED